METHILGLFLSSLFSFLLSSRFSSPPFPPAAVPHFVANLSIPLILFLVGFSLSGPAHADRPDFPKKCAIRIHGVPHWRGALPARQWGEVRATPPMKGLAGSFVRSPEVLLCVSWRQNTLWPPTRMFLLPRWPLDKA